MPVNLKFFQCPMQEKVNVNSKKKNFLVTCMEPDLL